MSGAKFKLAKNIFGQLNLWVAERCTPPYILELGPIEAIALEERFRTIFITPANELCSIEGGQKVFAASVGEFPKLTLPREFLGV
eukprot:1379285-Amphidinium_carterae.1